MEPAAIDPEQDSEGPESDLLRLIDLLCDHALATFDLNKDLLCNWQSELSPDNTNALHVARMAHDAILLFPEPACVLDAPACAALQRCVLLVDRLDNEAYYAFKLLLHATIYAATTALYATRVQLHCLGFTAFLARNMAHFIQHIARDLTPQNQALFAQKKVLLGAFFELGCDAVALRALVAPVLFGVAEQRELHLQVVSAAVRAHGTAPSFLVLNNFTTVPLSLPFAAESPLLACFSLALWFKVNRAASTAERAQTGPSCVTLSFLTSAYDAASAGLKIQLLELRKLVVVVCSPETGSHISFPFSRALAPQPRVNHGFSHVVVSLDTYLNLSLYVDGEYCESLPCPALTHHARRWNKIYVGGAAEEQDALSPFSRCELLVKDLCVVDTALRQEWVCFLYAQGVGYDWSHKDFSSGAIDEVVSHVPLQRLAWLLARIQDLAAESKPGTLQLGPSTTHDRTSQARARVVGALMQTKLRRSSVLFDLYAADVLYTDEASQGPHVYYHRTHTVNDALYALGGSGMFLVALENCIRDDTLPQAEKSAQFLRVVDTLLRTINSHAALAREFHDRDGYWILALLAASYKARCNPTLEFEFSAAAPYVERPAHAGLLECLLNSLLAAPGDRAGVLVANVAGYRRLVLGLHVYLNTRDFGAVETHLRQMLAAGPRQMREICARQRVGTRVAQLMRKHVLVGPASEAVVRDLDGVVRVVLAADASAETVRALAEIVVLALYHPSSRPDTLQLALNVLRALVDKFTDARVGVKDVRRFSRSISIHWILLLLQYQGATTFAVQVVCAGLALLAKLLKVLGAPVVRKFTGASRGLDVLAHALQPWWGNELVAAQVVGVSLEADVSVESDVVLGAFGRLVCSAEFAARADAVALPEFLLLLNRMALGGAAAVAIRQGRVLSAAPLPALVTPASGNELIRLAHDWLQVVDRMALLVRLPSTRTAAFQRVFCGAAWLESAFELVAYAEWLRLHAGADMAGAYAASHGALVDAVCGMFEALLPDTRLVAATVLAVNDITAKLVYAHVFPRLFARLEQTTLRAPFVFQEADTVRGVVRLLELYHDKYLQQNFAVTGAELDAFLECACAVCGRDGTPAKVTRSLGPRVARALVVRLAQIGQTREPGQVGGSGDGDDDALGARLDRCVKFCLYKQTLFLHQDVFSDEHVQQVVELVMGFFLRLSGAAQTRVAEHVLNFLRVVAIMRSASLERISKRIAAVSDYRHGSDAVGDFFRTLVTRNDDDTVRYLQRQPTARHVFADAWHFRMRKLDEAGSVCILDMVHVVLANSEAFATVCATHVERFLAGADALRATCLSGGAARLGRDEQDEQEADLFAAASFATIRSEVARAMGCATPPAYTLHDTEGVDRMRKLLVLEDQLADSERLSYAVCVPLKTPPKTLKDACHEDEFHNVDSLRSNADAYADAFSVGAEGLLLDVLDEYEEIDKNGDTDSAVPEDRNRKVLRSLYVGDEITSLFNVSRIQGLDSVESLMIVGHTHVYLIENYFHCVDGNVVDVDDAPRELCDPYIQLIRPQVASRTKTRFPKLHASRSWLLASLSCISRRKFLLRDIGLEMFFCDGASILITCTSTKQRNAVHAALAGHCSGKGLDRELCAAFDISSAPLHTIQDASAAGAFLSSRLASAFLASAAVAAKLLDLTHKWRHGRLSNFFYLMAVNTMAGRTANDLSQYPVFPWVLADYDSEALDLDASASFRDLARPMGAQSDARAAQFRERYHALESFRDAHAPPFHYGTHYSSAMIVASYLIRMRPFVLSYLLLQGGAFDHADRLFHSVRKAWRSASCDNTTDVRELTPEFFYLPDFLRNSNRFDLGTLHSGEPVDDVELPPWAHGSAHVFIARNRDALESTHVSRRLHLWIDLVFGCKQTGAEAEAALNVFHHLSYEGAINLDGIADEVEKRAMIGMINNFGQTPLKLFLRPHPPRLVYNAPDRYLAGMDASLRRLKLHAGTCSPHAVARLEYASGMWVGRAAGSCGDDSVLVWRPDASRAGRVFGTLFVGGAVHVNVHLAAVSAVLPVGDKRVLTAGVDGTIKCWDASAADARLVLQSVWRGHVHAVRALVHTRSFNVCISLDSHGGLVLWDVTRGRFVRQLKAPERVPVACTVSVSNDSGCVCVLAAVKYVNELTVYTLNGDALVRAAVEPGEVSCVAFAESRPSLVDAPPTDLLHVYWGSEFITVAYSLPQRVLRVYEMRCGAAGYAVRLAFTYDMTLLMQAAVTAMVVLKETEFDVEECLVRGRVSFVLGDARGHVYTY